MKKIFRVFILILSCISLIVSTLAIIEHTVRADAWIHGQNFPLHFTCDYGNLVNKEITGNEFEFNFLFMKGQFLQTYIANIAGDNATVKLISANGGEMYEQDLIVGGDGYAWNNLTYTGAYLWEFRSEGSTTFVVRATASSDIGSYWIGNCLSGPVKERVDND